MGQEILRKGASRQKLDFHINGDHSVGLGGGKSNIRES